MDAKVNLKSKPTEEKKKRKEVTSSLAFALVTSYKWRYPTFCRGIDVDRSSLKHASICVAKGPVPGTVLPPVHDVLSLPYQLLSIIC